MQAADGVIPVAGQPDASMTSARHVLKNRYLEAFSNMYRVQFGICLSVNVAFVALTASNAVPDARRQKAAFALGNILVRCLGRCCNLRNAQCSALEAMKHVQAASVHV